MREIGRKLYAILIYLNGNNEFKPETHHLMQKINETGSNDDIHILIQAGSIEQQIVEIIRPSCYFDGTCKCSSGVKRYSLVKHELIPLEDLGNINMADPMSLFDFVKWGMENYPAQYYVLALGGHVYQFVGINSDYSQNDHPYIMGLPEMSMALDMVCNLLNRKIDLLVLDTCYMNTIEVLYELGKESSPPVRIVLTYIYKGPFAGLPYHIFIKLIQKYSHTGELKLIIKNIIDTMDFNLIAFEIKHEILNTLKELFNSFARYYLTNKGNMDITPSELFTGCDTTFPRQGFTGYVKDISLCSEQLVIHMNKKSNVQGKITFAQNFMSSSRQLSLYNKLAFARENHWTNLLSVKLTDCGVVEYPEIRPVPMILPLQAVYYYISVLNPGLTAEENKAILKKLYDYKKWNTE